MVNGLITGWNTSKADVAEFFGDEAADVFEEYAADDELHTFIDVIVASQRKEADHVARD